MRLVSPPSCVFTIGEGTSLEGCLAGKYDDRDRITNHHVKQIYDMAATIKWRIDSLMVPEIWRWENSTDSLSQMMPYQDTFVFCCGSSIYRHIQDDGNLSLGKI